MPTPAYLNVDIINPSTGTTVAVNGTFVGSPNLDPSNIAIGVAPTGIAVTSHNNTLIGGAAGVNTTTGYQNTALGTYAAQSLTTGWDNVAVGTNPLFANVSGNENVAIGNWAAYSQTGGSGTVAVGKDALRFCTDYGSVAVGYNALRTLVTGFDNCAVGKYSLQNTTSGSGNTALGVLSGTAFVTGNNNTFIGYSTGDATLLSGSNNTSIGYNAEPSTSTANNQITLGNASITSLRCAVTSITSLSDARDKKEIVELPVGLEFIEGLKPVSFVWDDRNEEGKHDVKDFGFIAQDLKKSQEDAELSDMLKLVYEENPEKLEASYGKLIPILVKAIQELSAEVKSLKK